MKHKILIALVVLASAGTASAAETTIFRCGHEYTNVACADARTLVVVSAVDAGQRDEARRVALKEQALAAEMTRDRRAREAALKPALAGSLGAPHAAAPAAAEKKHAKKRKNHPSADAERDFVAAVPRTKKAGG